MPVKPTPPSSDRVPESGAPTSRVRKLPRGYRGVGHETIGTDILSLLDAVLMPEAILGRELCARLAAVKPKEWYPIEDLLSAFDHIDSRLGPDSMRKIGLSIFKVSHEAAVRRNLSSARDVVHGIDGLYRRANRGEGIGGWSVLEFAAGRAVLEKTTPHHCIVEEGILEGVLRTVGVASTIHQTQCFRRGHDACHFVISSHTVGARWG